MQNFLGTCAAVAVLAGGFALTGDLGWLLGRGMRVMQAADIPAGPAPAPVAVAPVAAPAVPRTGVAVPAPRVVGPDRLDLAATRPGQRILVWLDGAADPLAVDVVDPATAAVILHGGPPRRATVTGGTLIRGAPLRVVGLGLARGGNPGAAESLGGITGIAAIPAGR
ncbi:MAG: hypothetical protein ACKOZU_12255 [Planctomycetaceae bacterium]